MRLAEVLKDLADGKIVINDDYQILYRIKNNILQQKNETADAKKWLPTGFYSWDDWQNDSWELYKEKIKVKKRLFIYKESDGRYDARLTDPDCYVLNGDLLYTQQIEWEE